MSWLEAIVLGIVQGLTEFIPVSSTAHLKIVPVLFGWDDPGAAFTAVIQIGTLAAVLSYYWQDVTRVIGAMFADLRRGKLATTHDAWLGWMIAVGTLPIVVIGVLFRHQIKSTLRSLYVISASLAGVALLLAIAEWIVQRREAAGIRSRTVEEVGWRDAIGVGFAQAAALVPGTSRSGATIFGGLLCGLTREAAASFSFVLSIPAVFAAGVFELVEARSELMSNSLGPAKLIVATVVAGIVGYATIPWLLAYLRRHTMFVFIVYRVLLAGLLLYLLHIGWLNALPLESGG
ncbi:MAG TPA: undecaprenyl-diphosphatase UppP [Lacipirellulaceae bacterium]|nr:undecaprenyl-diphosphatase UppP [Lacipirellulaceae bacterium]